MPFLRFVVGNFRFGAGLLVLSPILFGLMIGVISAEKGKEWVLRYFLSGYQDSFLRGKGKEYSDNILSRQLRPSALKKLKEHIQQGHKCILVSASISYYLEYWGAAAGFDNVLCTEIYADDDGKSTGRIFGRNCKGEEKVRKLRALLDDEWPPDRLYAYGDSNGDIALLKVASDPHFKVFKD
jgi:HAD superfamily hydrolase (TIGR01490 family)